MTQRISRRSLTAIVTVASLAIITALFWGTWGLVIGPVPKRMAIPWSSGAMLVMPFPISRWWDVPFIFIWGIILIRRFGRGWGDNDLSIGWIIGLVFGPFFGLIGVLGLTFGWELAFFVALLLGWLSGRKPQQPYERANSAEFSRGFGQGTGAGFGLLTGLAFGFGPGLVIGFGAQITTEIGFLLSHKVRTFVSR